MIRDDDLKETIYDLICSKTEGENWDFKEYPYFYFKEGKDNKKDKRVDLLHDIICMANNVKNQDAYIIIGVSDKAVIKGVSQFTEAERWKQENYQDFVRSKKWAGDYKPDVEFRTIELCEKEIDVLIIHASDKVPFYLEEDVKIEKQPKIRANYIYTRKGAQNTPFNESASIHDIEILWKHRFHLYDTPEEEFEKCIKDSDGWTLFESNSEKMVWKQNNYTIELVEDTNTANYFPHLAEIQQNDSFSLQKLTIKYNGESLYPVFDALFIDETRIFVIDPKTKRLNIFDPADRNWETNLFLYYEEDSLDLDLMKLLQKILRRQYEELEDYLNTIPIFENENHLIEIEEYINKNKDQMRKLIAQMEPEIPVTISQRKREADIRGFWATTFAVKRLLKNNGHFE